MKAIVFELVLLAGVVLTGAGVGLQFGLGYGLAAAGVVVIGLGVYLSRVAGVVVDKTPR